MIITILQTSLERKLLEEAREARRKEREGFNDDVAAERRALAQEHADMQRQLEACRAELLALKSRWDRNICIPPCHMLIGKRTWL